MIDQDPAGALTALHHVYRENEITALPELSPLSPRSDSRTAAIQLPGAGVTINGYNLAHDIADLLRFYGARPTRRRGLYFCPFHGDEHASLTIYTQRGQHYCHCFSAHSNCPLATHRRNDAFNVYCIGEGVDAKAAQRLIADVITSTISHGGFRRHEAEALETEKLVIKDAALAAELPVKPKQRQHTQAA